MCVYHTGDINDSEVHYHYNDIKWIKFMKHLLSLYRSQGALEYWIRILELHDHDMIRSM